MMVYKLGMNSPERLRDELFNLFCLVDAEPKSWSLARPVGEHSYSRSLDRGQQPVRLESRECYSDLEIKHLSGINRYTLIIVRQMFQALKRRNNIFVRN